MKKGIIFLIDLLFALLIASSIIYVVSNSSYNIYSVGLFENSFPYDVVAVYTQTQDINIIQNMFKEKGYSGQLDDVVIGPCNPEKKDVYIKYMNGHKVVYCRVK